MTLQFFILITLHLNRNPKVLFFFFLNIGWKVTMWLIFSLNITAMEITMTAQGKAWRFYDFWAF